MLLQSVLDPGHGLFSSFDEQIVAVSAFVLLTLVGILAEFVGESKGVAVLGALFGFTLAIVFWAPPLFAAEWHYAILAAVPILVVGYLYKRRPKPALTLFFRFRPR